MLNFENWIKCLEDRCDQSAKFINTLSMLEYMGARKIFKSQRSGAVSLDLLSHISEEVRHAEVLKKLALKISDGKLISYSDEYLMCGQAARIYIQKVDHTAEQQFGKQNPWVSYLYTTLLLEERAKQIYPACGALVEKQGFPNVFKGILREEDRHLEAILQELGSTAEVTPEKLEILKTEEDQAFHQFLQSLAAEVRFFPTLSTPAPCDSNRIDCTV